ncbi:hypothetical protein [Natrinema altunense]|uniref:Uncharacterized protein n=1 Tax=Natrinema altunense (strain JCM 12890 / CGMCC 1.3731 / AJ2) TaxID=1227494 RepID=L9ZL70_NATA2|nr:hypothetical protein [Natrinema altunense]ELY86796.1 hypothetical protein C485_07757 [Natrinema altunense JCM 12890]
MGDKKFTLVELHIDGETQFGLGSIGKALPISSIEPTAETDHDLETETDEETADESGGTGKSAVGALVALVVLVGIAAAAKKFRGGDEERELEAEEEPDVIVN